MFSFRKPADCMDWGPPGTATRGDNFAKETSQCLPKSRSFPWAAAFETNITAHPPMEAMINDCWSKKGGRQGGKSIEHVLTQRSLWALSRGLHCWEDTPTFRHWGL